VPGLIDDGWSVLRCWDGWPGPLGILNFVGGPSFVVGRAGLLSRLSLPWHEKSAFPFDIQMQSDRLNLKAEDKIPASELKDTYEKQETQHIETGNSK
jgi:hypothetical protein